MGVVLAAFGLGFVFCALPGAVTAQAIRRGLERGFRSALALQLGALSGVALWAVLALAGIAILARQTLVLAALDVMGGIFLLWLTWQALHAAEPERGVNTTGKAATGAVVGEGNLWGDAVLGVLFSLANPGALAFWLSVGSLALTPEAPGAAWHGLALFWAGFLAGALLWCVLFASLLAWGRRIVSPLFFRLISIFCGLALGFFAFKLLWSAVFLVK